jgi:transposase, IS30 family
MRSQGFGCRSIARQLNRSALTSSCQLERNALADGAYRPSIADGGDLLRRQRAAVLKMDAKLVAYVTDRLAERWASEQIARRLLLGIETGLRAACPETIYGWICRAEQKTGRLWRYLTRAHARRRKRHARASRDRIVENLPCRSGLPTPTPVKRWAIGMLTASLQPVRGLYVHYATQS